MGQLWHDKSICIYSKCKNKIKWSIETMLSDRFKLPIKLIEEVSVEETGRIKEMLLYFCDGEGYYVTLSTNAHTKLWVWDIDNAITPIISPDHAYPSRQEAFEQGIIKAFSLMEERNK